MEQSKENFTCSPDPLLSCASEAQLKLRDAATILREFSEDWLSYSQEMGVRNELNLNIGDFSFRRVRPERFGNRNSIDPASQSPEKPA
jgi:hypothetical protein